MAQGSRLHVYTPREAQEVFSSTGGRAVTDAHGHFCMDAPGNTYRLVNVLDSEAHILDFGAAICTVVDEGAHTVPLLRGEGGQGYAVLITNSAPAVLASVAVEFGISPG